VRAGGFSGSSRETGEGREGKKSGKWKDGKRKIIRGTKVTVEY